MYINDKPPLVLAPKQVDGISAEAFLEGLQPLASGGTGDDVLEVIAGDVCALKINVDGSVRTRPYSSALPVTNRAHPARPPVDRFMQ